VESLVGRFGGRLARKEVALLEKVKRQRIKIGHAVYPDKVNFVDSSS